MLDSDVKEAIQKYADKKNVSMGWVMREAMVAYIVTSKIETKKKKNVFKYLMDSRKEISFKGPKDLSKNIDKYVYDV